MSDLVKQMRLIAGMRAMGEKINFGHDADLLFAGADRIEELEDRVVELEAELTGERRSARDERLATPKQREFLRDLLYRFWDDPSLTLERASYLIEKLLKEKRDLDRSEAWGAFGDIT